MTEPRKKTPAGAGAWRVALYVAVAAAPLVVVYLLRPPSRFGFVYELGRSFALVGFMVLALQFLLAARVKWITRVFGFDLVIRYHRYAALFGATLVILHPFLLAVGSGQWTFVISFNVPWYIWAGKIAVVVLLLHACLSLFGMPPRLGWERWRFGHDVLAPLFLSLIFVHSILIGGDLRPRAMQVMWVGVLAAAFALFVWHRVLKPAALARRPYEVVGVTPEAPGVWTVSLAPAAGEKRFDYLPGQFQFLTLERGRGLPREEHHFTVSSSPTLPDVVTSTIKELGDFTATVKETRVGDRAVVDAPYGRFSYLHHPDERALCFVAGGIGITPIMSMLRHLRDTKSELAATLFYGNHDASQIVFRDELEELARGERPRLRLVHVLADPPEGWTGERGRIDAAVLRKYLPDDLSAFGFYLCGPSGLVSSTVKNLRRLGVAYSRIHVEIFSFLD